MIRPVNVYIVAATADADVTTKAYPFGGRAAVWLKPYDCEKDRAW